MANGALAQQMGQLFGTGAVVSFDTPSKEIGMLPGVDEIAPNPLQAATLAGTLTYTPPKEVIRSTPQATQTDSDFTPAFQESIFIEPPSLDDRGQVTDLAEFSGLDRNSLNALGLIGLTPTSLSNTFSNLLNIENIDPTQTGINLAKNIDPAVGAALNIATGRTVNSLTNALNNPDIFSTPAQIFSGYSALNTILNLDFDKISDIPNKAVDTIQSIIDGFANLIENPIASINSFLDLAGQYVEGTKGATFNNFQFGKQQVNFATKQSVNKFGEREVELLGMPGYLKEMLPGPMKLAPSMLMAFQDFLATNILPGPGLTYAEQVAQDLETMEGAQFGVGVDLGQGVTTHTGPFGSVVSFHEIDVPGIGSVSAIMDYDRMTNPFSGIFGFDQYHDLQSAAIGNSLGGFNLEEIDQIAEVFGNYSADIKSSIDAAQQIADFNQAVYEELVHDNLVDDLDRADLEYTQNSKAFDEARANRANMLNEAEIFDPELDALNIQPGMQALSKGDRGAIAYMETVLNPVDFEAPMTPQQALEMAANIRKADAENAAIKSFNEAVQNAGTFDPGGYNDPTANISSGTLGLANYVMGRTGRSTFTNQEDEMQIANEVREAAMQMGFHLTVGFDKTPWDFVGQALGETPADTTVNEAFDATNDPDIAEATFDVSPEDDPTESGEGADTDDGGMSASDAGDLGDL